MELVLIRYPNEHEIFQKKFFHHLELISLGVILCRESEFHIFETWKSFPESRKDYLYDVGPHFWQGSHVISHIKSLFLIREKIFRSRKGEIWIFRIKLPLEGSIPDDENKSFSKTFTFNGYLIDTSSDKIV